MTTEYILNRLIHRMSEGTITLTPDMRILLFHTGADVPVKSIDTGHMLNFVSHGFRTYLTIMSVQHSDGDFINVYSMDVCDYYTLGALLVQLGKENQYDAWTVLSEEKHIKNLRRDAVFERLRCKEDGEIIALHKELACKYGSLIEVSHNGTCRWTPDEFFEKTEVFFR